MLLLESCCKTRHALVKVKQLKQFKKESLKCLKCKLWSMRLVLLCSGCVRLRLACARRKFAVNEALLFHVVLECFVFTICVIVGTWFVLLCPGCVRLCSGCVRGVFEFNEKMCSRCFVQTLQKKHAVLLTMRALAVFSAICDAAAQSDLQGCHHDASSAGQS